MLDVAWPGCIPRTLRGGASGDDPSFPSGPLVMKIREFHCIMPIANIPSVMKRGVLSFHRASRLAHRSVAMPEVQERRNKVRIPAGRPLHDYANFYLDARNPMLYARKDHALQLCVLRVSTEARHIEGAVLADRNASSDYARFLAINQAKLLDLEAIYSRDWRHPDDKSAAYRHKSQKCAEFLVPHRLPPELIEGAYVVSAAAKRSLVETGFAPPVTIDPDMFFC